MRLPLIVAALMMSAPAASEGPLTSGQTPQTAPLRTLEEAGLDPAKTCQTTKPHLAEDSDAPGQGLRPRNLNELPSATGYMAVYRTVDGCEVPLTVADYRSKPFR